MGKGGGSRSPQHTTSTVTQNTLPEYARPWFENLLGRTAYESTRPYTPYPGTRMAYFDPYESMAQEGTAQMAMQGAPPQIGAATDITTQVGYQPTGQGMDIARQFQPPEQRTDYSGGSVANPYTVGSYMNPYQQYVTDIGKREAMRESDIMSNQIAGQAAQAGGLGGYREGIMQAERQRNLGQRLGDIQAQGSLAGYQQAMQGIEADRRSRMEEDTRRMQARQQNAALMEQRARLGLSGLGQDMGMRGQSLQAAGMLGDLGKADQAMALERLGAMGGVGEIRRGMLQRSLDTGYEDYLRQKTYPYQQLNIFSQMLQGLPVTPEQTRSIYGGPSAAQQALGAGIGGLGLYRALRGG
jgi:hypothetical protein